MTSRSYAGVAGLMIVLALSWFAYHPGIHGPFLFDDYANLPALGATGPVDNGAALARYLTSGGADPTGRPVALASFLMDAHDWPADASAFKRTNVLLHLLNGVMLFVCCLLLGRRYDPAGSQPSGRLVLAAAFTAGAWLLHPLFVSTTLYIVQREAMLVATFVLAGLLGWLTGMSQMDAGHRTRGSLTALTAMVGCTALAILSKANGALLPALIFIVEATYPGASANTRKILPWSPSLPWQMRIALAFGWCVTAAVILMVMVYAFHGAPPQRPWTIGQRVITEPRVLWDYLRLLWLPHPYTAGVFNDQLNASTSLWHPWTTPIAMVGLIALVVATVRIRKYAPSIALALGFFLVGHAMEGTTVPLELYFEHRNYVPALLMFFPLGLWLSGLVSGRQPVSALLRTSLAAILLLALATMTWLNASLWGDTRDQAELWARMNPASRRAAVNAAQADLVQGRPLEAVKRLKPMLVEHPDEVQVAFNLLAAECAAGTASDDDIRHARQALMTSADPGSLIVTWFGRAITAAKHGECPALGLDALGSIAQAGLSNPRFSSGRRQDLLNVSGSIRLARGDGRSALADYNAALLADPRPGIALEQAALLGSAGFANEGLAHLQLFDSVAHQVAPAGPGMPSVHAWVLDYQDYWAKQNAHLKAALLEDIHNPSSRDIAH
ncbi:hypothetical protein [Luteibacter sp. 9133]|uniref:hypothetical protein n=1 Tax=Luteibacter sp. 9133 TaxID=1500891 RepID=UPI00068AFAC5|nr:hypothetical protein [Luteibacter sp. 9133]